MKCTTIRLARIIVCILYAHNIYADFTLYGKTIMVPRSSSCNAARDLVGSRQFLYRHDRKGFYTNFSVTPEYASTYNTHRIAQYFFGYNAIDISGSLVDDRGENDILADYFGLSPKFQSVVVPHPHISYTLTTFDWFVGYHNFYFRAILPVGITRWSVCLDESIVNDGSGTLFPPLYMDEYAVLPPADSFNEAMAGVSYGQVDALRFGRINGSQKYSGASDLVLMLGGLIVNHEESHVGFHLRCAAPTGNKPNPEYFFTPILGNGHFWELGLCFTSHTQIWERDDEEFISLWVDMNGTYFFNTHQYRSFDLYEPNLCNPCDSTLARFGSRYILAKNFDSTGNYTGVTAPLINSTTLDCKVNANLQFDIVFMFAYQHKHLGFDIGYNGWIKSRELVKLDDCDCQLTNVGLKGIQNVEQVMPVMDSPVTQSTATLHGNYLFEQSFVSDSNSPVLVSCPNIDPQSAATSSQMTHKIFAHINHVWDPMHCVQPYLGVGGEVEFEGIRPSDLPPMKNTRSLWALWAKGGFAY
jgi:hypothetical protein